MNELILVFGLLIGSCRITAYQSVSSQTDNSPYYTSIGERTHAGGVATSRDMLCPICRWLHRRCGHHVYLTKFHYQDRVYISQLGLFTINDVMGETRYDSSHHKNLLIRRSFDIWVGSLSEEKRIKPQMQNVYRITKEIK